MSIPELTPENPGPSSEPPKGAFTEIEMRLGGVLDRRWGWDRVPLWPSILTLVGLRETLRRYNLVDPDDRKVAWGPEPPDRAAPPVRRADGTRTDPRDRKMGGAKTAFGRNVAISDTVVHDVLKPNPRTISNALLARRQFLPATSVNLLTAAWIQFEVHDWMSHGRNDATDPWKVDVDPNDFPTHPMRINRTRSDGDRPPRYRNDQSHWWDASQVYGTSRWVAKKMRTGEGGRLHSDFPYDPPNGRVPKELAPLKGSWWAGLAMFHALFMREHNAICDHLAKTHRDRAADDQWLYDKARLIVAALIAKIHTVEWSTAMLADHRAERSLRANWWGLLGRDARRTFGRLSSDEALSGIPGSPLSHHGVPYALTEEFLAVYRLHPMIPDDVEIRSTDTGELIERAAFEALSLKETSKALGRLRRTDLFYSFGLAHPGQVTLRNYPDQLREFKHPLDGCVDLASIDILRDRERGVLRYNDFRRRLRLPPATRFEDFSDDPEVIADLKRIYPNPEMVDLMIGLYAEKKPDGFAISDTAFRIFIVMASRRLKSDRFFTDDFRPEIYTEEGLRWIEENTLVSILRRHHPELKRHLRDVENAFKPWNRPASSKRQSDWPIRQWVWNQVTATKFAAAEPVRVRKPEGDGTVVPIPFTHRFPDIPIDGLVVADHFPKLEVNALAQGFVGAEEWLARRFPAAADGLPSISADPRVALDAAFSPTHRRLYREPVRPDAYDPLDLGALALNSPYAYLLAHRDGDTFEWDLTRHEDLDCQEGLYKPCAKVEFTLEGKRLRATAIQSELGHRVPTDPDWAVAQRIAMCAAATHLTLVRHFNWIHLVGGERFALATNQHLPNDHPVRRLLQPHVFATHFGNRIVTPLQLAPGGDFERLFSYTHRGLCDLFRATAKEFDLATMDPFLDAENRGVDTLPGNGALRNRRQLMRIIRAHVGRYLRVAYNGRSRRIDEDHELKCWYGDLDGLFGKGENGAPELTMDVATDVIAALIYMVTVDHEIVDSGVWDYHLWSDVVNPRVYRDGRRMAVDVYQRLVNSNFILNVDRTTLMTDFSYLALDAESDGPGARAFKRFQDDLAALQRQMDRTEPSTWRIEPRNLKANINY